MGHGSHRLHRKPDKLTIAIAAIAGVLVVTGIAALAITVVRQSTATASLPNTSSVGPSGLQVPPSMQARPETDQAIPPTFGPGTSTLLIGDSLAVGIAQPLAELMPDRELVVEAAEGRNTPTSVALVTDHVDYTPSIWVVSLGTNDYAEEFPDQARQLLDLAGDGRCVVWFDVHRPGYDEPIDETLQQLATTHPNVHLIPWDRIADAHPEWFLVDEIHPDGEGYQRRAQLAAQAVQSVCTTSGPTDGTS